MTALVWFRRDLRLHDHPALCAALEDAEEVVPVFCLDDRVLNGRHASGPRTQFLLESLAELDTTLRRCGSGLVVRHGEPEREIVTLARELDAHSVHWAADVSRFARARDHRVAELLSGAGIEAHSHPGLFAVDEPASIRTTTGSPYTMFTPFYRAWSKAPRRQPLAAPSALPQLPAGTGASRLPRLSDLGLDRELEDPARGGESAARERLRGFLSQTVDGYESSRNLFSADGVSRLSPYLHFGCLSARELETLLPSSEGSDAFRRQLCWRDFYAQVLFHFPTNARSEHQERYRGRIRWSHAERRFKAWCEGRTGYPLVDAAMRQLLREGWIHNRGRLPVGSFLTKDLGIDWRWGERWFMRWLLDGDEASNNGNWQWIASVGVDPQPPARRLYNPTLQQRRYDPGGAYVRRCPRSDPSRTSTSQSHGRCRARSSGERAARSAATIRSRSSTTPWRGGRHSSATRAQGRPLTRARSGASPGRRGGPSR